MHACSILSLPHAVSVQSVRTSNLNLSASIAVRIISSQQDCQLTGCMNGGLCLFIEASKTFSCVNYCAGNPCLHGGTCMNLADGYKCSCTVGQYTGKICEQGKLSPLICIFFGFTLLHSVTGKSQV